jgi:hypothetical protein
MCRFRHGERPNDVRDAQTHRTQCRHRDSCPPAQPSQLQGLRPNGRRRSRKQASLVRSGCQPHTHSASERSWRSVAANIATVIGARTPVRSWGLAGSSCRRSTNLHRSSRSVSVESSSLPPLGGTAPRATAMSHSGALPARRIGGGFRLKAGVRLRHQRLYHSWRGASTLNQAGH